MKNLAVSSGKVWVKNFFVNTENEQTQEHFYLHKTNQPREHADGDDQLDVQSCHWRVIKC